MRSLLITALMTLLAVAVLADTTWMHIRVYLDTKADYLKVRQLYLDQVYKKDNYIEVVADTRQYQRIKESGLRMEVVIEDVVAFNQSRRLPSFTQVCLRLPTDAASTMALPAAGPSYQMPSTASCSAIW